LLNYTKNDPAKEFPIAAQRQILALKEAKMNKGVNRLAILLGGLGALYALDVFAFPIASAALSDAIVQSGWLILLSITLVTNSVGISGYTELKGQLNRSLWLSVSGD
jgi:hypothetical protein